LGKKRVKALRSTPYLGPDQKGTLPQKHLNEKSKFDSEKRRTLKKKAAVQGGTIDISCQMKKEDTIKPVSFLRQNKRKESTAQFRTGSICAIRGRGG